MMKSIVIDGVTLLVEPESGEIRRKNGRIAGGEVREYRRVSIGKRGKLEAHRIVWLAVHGDVPEGMQIDHINGDKFDNRITNLRLSTPSQNQANRRTLRGAVPFKGVCRVPCGKYQAGIKVNGKSIHLGWFRTPQEAADAYDKAAIRYHGEYAATNKKLRAA